MCSQRLENCWVVENQTIIYEEKGKDLYLDSVLFKRSRNCRKYELHFRKIFLITIIGV